MKKQFAIAFTLFLALAFADISSDHSETDDETFDEDSWTHYLIKGTNGLYGGFRQGFYHLRHPEMPPNCLTHEACQEFYFIYQFVEEGELWDLLPLLGKLAGIIDNMAECGFESILKDIDDFCKSDDGVCTQQAILDNLTQNLFQIISKINNFIEIAIEYPAYDTEEFYEQNYEIGKDFGSVIRFVYNFEKVE